ncbi:hypothetical protein KAH43_00060 [Candidatus Bipolaricaulota bacterium]|nr:hypothetical protein [Candidatus Bipolaricaulota bacterium]
MARHRPFWHSIRELVPSMGLSGDNRILEYNEDDCLAMRVLADALRKLGGG